MGQRIGKSLGFGPPGARLSLLRRNIALRPKRNIMTTLLLGGLAADITPDQIQAEFAPFGPIDHIEIVHDGDPQQPVALVRFNLDPIAAANIAERINGRWHAGRFLTAHVTLHSA